MFPGGSAANTVHGLAKLGIITGFTGVVGNDDEGRLIIDDFEKVGVNTSKIVLKQGVKTGATLCLSTHSGRRSIYVMPGANNLLSENDIDLAYMNQTKLLYLSSFVSDKQFQLSLELVDKL